MQLVAYIDLCTQKIVMYQTSQRHSGRTVPSLTLVGKRSKASSHGQALSHDRLTDVDVTIGQYAVSDRNLACTTLIGHRTLSDGDIKVCMSYDSASHVDRGPNMGTCDSKTS